MAVVDSEAIRRFAKNCEEVADMLKRYGNIVSGGSFGNSDGLSGIDLEEPDTSSTDTEGRDKIADDASFSDGKDFSGYRVSFLQTGKGPILTSWRESQEISPDNEAFNGDVAPWVLPMMHDWNINVQGRVTDLERAHEEITKIYTNLYEIANSWDDADSSSAAEIAKTNEDVDWDERSWLYEWVGGTPQFSERICGRYS